LKLIIVTSIYITGMFSDDYDPRHEILMVSAEEREDKASVLVSRSGYGPDDCGRNIRLSQYVSGIA
jgi:hypothetical protein